MAWCCSCDGYEKPTNRINAKALFKITEIDRNRQCVYCGYYAVWKTDHGGKIVPKKTRAPQNRVSTMKGAKSQKWKDKLKERDEKRERIILPLIEQGRTAREIAAFMGVTYKRIYCIFKETPSLQNARDRQKQKIKNKTIELFSKGKSIHSIGKTVGISRHTVKKYLDAENLL